MSEEIHKYKQICGEIYYPGNRIGVLLVHSLSSTPYKLEFWPNLWNALILPCWLPASRATEQIRPILWKRIIPTGWKR